MMYRLFYRAAIKVVRQQRDQYEADVKDWYDNGDGRNPDWQEEMVDGEVFRFNAGGKGYRYPYCPHGTSLWTDYDNICGGCEDPMTVLQEASYLARDWCLKYEARLAWFNQKPGEMPVTLVDAIVDWVTETLKPLEVLHQTKK